MSNAYEILSDPEKRKTYDQFGLEYMMRGGPEPTPGGGGPGGMPFEMPGGFQGFGGGMPGGTRTFHFSTGPGGSRGFKFSNAEDIFSNFARSGGGGLGDDDIFSMFGGLGGGGPSPFGGRAGNGPRRPPTPEVTTLEKQLPVSLEDLYHGVHKKMKIKRKTFDQVTGKRSVEDKILEFDIKPGLKAGSKIKFKGVGDQEEGGTQDLHFIIAEVRFPS